MDLGSYDYIIVAFSGGKDSIACLLHLYDIGAPIGRVELWHHCIDGKEGSSLMDWPVTGSYCQAVAKAFSLPIYFSWRNGGFEREMLRDKQRTAPVSFETPGDNIIECGGKRGGFTTRRKFPQVSSDLSVRWCSAYLKIDVCTMAIRNQPRFLGKRTLVITSERAEESAARKKYKEFSVNWADCRDGKRRRRHVDHWRPVHEWLESRVWETIGRYRINPHPAYKLGWGRLSCAACVFGSMHQWASLNAINPQQVARIAAFEKEFETTIHRKRSIPVQVSMGKVYEGMRQYDIVQALTREYFDTILVDEWELPNGAYGENVGPS